VFVVKATKEEDMAKNGTKNAVPLKRTLQKTNTTNAHTSESIAVVGNTVERQDTARTILAKSGEIFREAFHQSPIGMSIDDMDGHFLLVNRSFCEMMGYDENEIYEMSYTRLSYPDEVELNDNLMLRQNLLKGDISMGTMDKRCIHKDGHIIHIILQLSLLRDSQGQPLYFLGQTLNISQRKHAEDVLRQQLLELKTVDQISKSFRVAQTEQELVEILLDEALALANTSHGAIFLSREADAIIRLEAHRGWFKILLGVNISRNKGVIDRVLNSGELQVSNDLGSDLLRHASLQTNTLPELKGVFVPIRSGQEVVGVLAIALHAPAHIDEATLRLLSILADIGGNAIQREHMHESVQRSFEELQREISNRKNMQVLLAKEKELLSTSLLSIGEAVISVDRDGNVSLFNHAATEITGFTAQEAIGHPLVKVFRILDDQTHQISQDPIPYLERMNVLEKETVAYIPPTLVTKNGEKLLVSGKVSPIKIRGNVVAGHILVFDNITEKRMQEAQSTLSQKMEAIGQLAAGIAHEINTPIQYVGDNLSYLKRAYSRFEEMLGIYQEFLESHAGLEVKTGDILALAQTRKEKKIEHYKVEIPNAIEEALDGVERVRKIVLAIREFSHPSEKEKKLADINQGILTTITISRNEWKYVAEMETELDATLPLVWCQIDEINQVILNMIVNAAQAIQEVLPKDFMKKGRIRIATRAIKDKAVITIQDTGNGIPEEICGRIFDPFFTTKGVGKGTGQGLSIAHNIIVKKHGGSISVASKVGEGTTFTIELPVESTSGESQ